MIWLGAFVVLVLAVLLYSCCIVAGDADKREESLKHQNKIGDLSDLENQTLDRLLRAFEEDGVNFMINDGRVVNYEIEECE